MRSEIPFIKPKFPHSSEIATDIDAIVRANWYTNFGPKEQQFSRALEAHVGGGVHVATLANGTLALIAAISCIIGRGNRDRFILMPSFTFIAVPQAAIWNNYRPWFIDIDPANWQPSVGSARAVLEASRDKIAGILVPNVFGVGNPDIGSWEQLSAEWGLPLIIDSAAGFGSKYREGELVGARGMCEIFSFHATKPFAIGEGGALTSRDPYLVDRVRGFQNFGFDETRSSHLLGMNGKLSEIGAAIGIRQLAGLENRLAGRREIFEGYRHRLEPKGLTFQPNAEKSSHWCASVSAESPSVKRLIIDSLKLQGIQVRDYYNPALHLHPYFLHASENYQSGGLEVTDDICSRIISLPIHDNMNALDFERVVVAVSEGMER